MADILLLDNIDSFTYNPQISCVRMVTTSLSIVTTCRRKP